MRQRPLMVRFLLLRFLPRRLVPLLFLLEIVRLVRRWQTRDDPVAPAPKRVGPVWDAPAEPRRPR
jgi:hypothetical protein